MGGSKPNERVFSPQSGEIDGLASEVAAPSPSQETGSSLRPPETIMVNRTMCKVRRTVSSPFSGPCSHGEVCLASPFTALDAFSLSSAHEERALPSPSVSSGSGERPIYMPDVSASRRDVRNLIFTQDLEKLRKDRDEPEETCKRKSDRGLEGSVSKHRKSGFVGIEPVNVHQGAMQESGNRVPAIKPAAASVKNPPDDENVRKHQRDAKGRKAGFFGIEDMNANEGSMHEQKDTVGAINPAARSFKNPRNDENVRKHQRDGDGEHISRDYKDQMVDNQRAQSFTSVTKGSDNISSDNTPVTSSSFSFGTTPLSFGTPTGFELFRSTSSRWSSNSIFGLKAVVEGNFSSPSTAFQNSNGISFQSYSSQRSSLASCAPVSQPVQTTAESLQSQEVPVPTGDKVGKGDVCG